MPLTQQIDKTSAEDKSIGFDYQYYYFLNELINLKSGQTIGLEVMDDVHSELSENIQILVQLKHTIQTNSGGVPKNLTTLDGDLWKSLSNWCKVISDKEAGREDVSAQLAFIGKTHFLLATNKSANDGNTFLKAVEQFQAEEKEHSELLIFIKSLKTKTKNKAIVQYISEVLQLKEPVSKSFLKNLRFDLGCDKIIQKCKDSIREKHIDESKVDDVFSNLDSRLRENNYMVVKSEEKIVITFDDFHQNYRIYFDNARNEKLTIRPLLDLLPDKMTEQTFIKQLLDITDISLDDIEDITDFTTKRLHLRNNIDQWYREGDITQDDINLFEEEAKQVWSNKFRALYRKDLNDEDHQVAALNLLDELRNNKLAIANQNLPLSMCNGNLYELSDRPDIGWRYDWEEKYK